MKSNHNIQILLLIATGIIGGAALTGSASDPVESNTDAKGSHGEFTGDIKIVFYVSDVKKAVAFYENALGFKFHHYYDHVTGDSARTWVQQEPPIYAEMSFAGRRFGLHLPTSDRDRESVGKAKTYFRVKDLDQHRRRATAWDASPSAIKKRSWMDMFLVADEDGNRIYFAYTDDATHGNPWFGR